MVQKARGRRSHLLHQSLGALLHHLMGHQTPAMKTEPNENINLFMDLLEMYTHTVPVKSLDTPTHSRVFLYFDYFLHCRTIVKTSKLLKNT